MRFAPQRRAVFHFSSGKPALANLLFDRPDPEIIGKTQCCATFLTFGAPVSDFFSFSLLFFSRVLLFSAFLSPYCRKFDF